MILMAILGVTVSPRARCGLSCRCRWTRNQTAPRTEERMRRSVGSMTMQAAARSAAPHMASVPLPPTSFPPPGAQQLTTEFRVQLLKRTSTV